MKYLVKYCLAVIGFALWCGNVSADGRFTDPARTSERPDASLMCLLESRTGTERETVSLPLEDANAIAKRGDGYHGPCAIYGDKRSLGDGYFKTYVQMKGDGTPWAIGIEFPETTFNNLPTQQYDGSNCFDVNGNGVLDFDDALPGGVNLAECGGGHARELDFPMQASIAPFKWAQVAYQAHGHTPEQVYSVPHLDFHFFTQDRIERNFIRLGPCALLIDCNDMITAQKPIPTGYIHPDYIDVGAAESRSGNHLVDPTSPEWNGQPFTWTWIYGAYDGHLTFWEPMIANSYFESKPSVCNPLKLPTYYAESGYYPTQFCVRYRPKLMDYTVSLEKFVYRVKQ